MPNLSDLTKTGSINSLSAYIVGYDASDTSQASTGTTVVWPATAFQTLAWAVSANYGIQNISSVYTTVNSNSALTWNYQGTDVKSLTSNWQNTYTTVNVNSAIWIKSLDGVYYVDNANGSDITGNGSMNRPFSTFNAAYAAGVGSGSNFSIQLSRGSYQYEPFDGSFLDNSLISVRGVGSGDSSLYATSLTINLSDTDGNPGGGRQSKVLYVNDLVLTFSAAGGNSEFATGGNGGYIWISGNAVISSINVDGGEVGGNGGTIVVEGGLKFSPVGAAMSLNGQTKGTLYADNCDLRGLSSITSGATLILARSSYDDAVITPTTDLGGNAAY